MLKKKRPQEYKLRAFVGILFLSIVFLVGFAYVYHQQVLQVCWLDIITAFTYFSSCTVFTFSVMQYERRAEALKIIFIIYLTVKYISFHLCPFYKKKTFMITASHMHIGASHAGRPDSSVCSREQSSTQNTVAIIFNYSYMKVHLFSIFRCRR